MYDTVCSFEYHRYLLQDSEDQQLSHLFDEIHTVLHSKRARGEAVLIHCAAGVSRSATIVLSYVMKTRGLSVCVVP